MLSNYRGNEFVSDTPKIMGILNITPDSFSDGGHYLEQEKAVERALMMFDNGADIVDIGGESTRPGALPVTLADELQRVLPVISAVKKINKNGRISLDTYKSAVAVKGIEAGADIINDISALRFDEGMIDVLKQYQNISVVLMHIQGTPRNMQDNPHYDNPVEEIKQFFDERINYCIGKGIKKERIIIDPGIGFGKRFKDNMEIMNRIDEFNSFGLSVLLGASRKSFINQIYSSKPEERLEGSLAAAALAYFHKIGIIRVHDVKETYNFIKTLKALLVSKNNKNESDRIL